MRIVTAAILVAFCSSASALEVTFSVPSSFQEPIIQGSTNLPDDTGLIVSLRTPEPACRPNCKLYQSKTTVIGGRFKSERFGAPPGTYTVEITTAIAKLSPPSVQAVIGKLGEKLTGRYVVKEILPGFGPTIEYKSDITISGK